MPSKEASVDLFMTGIETPSREISGNNQNDELIDAVKEKLRVVPDYGSVQGAPAS